MATQSNELKGRITLKHDTETNWLKATGFSPLIGEIIIYDKDSTHDYQRIKIGDGTINVNNLPFINEVITNDEIDAICNATIYNAEEVTY